MLVSVLDDDSDDLGHLHSESEGKEGEGVSAYTGQQQFGLEKLAVLSQVVSTESLASSSSSSRRSSCSSSRLCSGPEEQLLDFTGVLEQQQDYILK